MKSLLDWFVRNRTSARVAFVLRTACMAGNAVLSLVWTPLLLRALGADNYGTYMAFAAFLAVTAASEFGFGAATALATNRLIATSDLPGLRRLHANSRTIFLGLALVGASLMLVLSPWLPGWLHFRPDQVRGSLTVLFALGACNVGVAILTSYLNNSSYAVGTVVWPIVPAFVIAQAGLAAQVWLGSMALPLWAVHLSSLTLSVAGLGLAIFFYRHSHAVFAESLPLRLDLAEARDLLVNGLWSYPFGITLLINVATDRLMVNAFFGAGQVPAYQLNYKLCELALTLTITASAVSMPKIVARLLSPEAAAKTQGVRDVRHLARFQAFLGFVAMLGYFFVNDAFIRWLFGDEFRTSLGLQAAFAATLLLTVNSDVFVQLCGRLESRGLRVAGFAVLSGALINLGLSWLAAAQYRWLAGIGWATAVAQVLVFGVVGEYVRRRDALGPAAGLVWRGLIAPLAGLGIAAALKAAVQPATLASHAVLAVAYLLLLAAYIAIIGPGWRELRAEAQLIARQVGIGSA